LLLEGHGRLVRLVLLAKAGDVPDSDSEIHGGGDDKVIPGVELGAPNNQLRFGFGKSETYMM
jgi:hypothetical protein